jgi:two-component sensor histidine kinase
VDVEDVDLGIDRAIPCGIILNELVSNSFKHAFSDTVRGKINIGFHSSGSGKVKMQVSDNGRGLPLDFDISKISSLGMQLVNSLVTQLNGTLHIKKSGGASFTVTFPVQD